MRVAPLLIVVSGVLLVGGGVATYAAEGDDPSSHYRLSTASIGDVEETLTTSGTVDAAGRADVATPVDGTVARVRVRSGQKVKSGQVLATLERTELRTAVTQAEAALAVARAQLETDKDAQDDLVDDAATSTPSEPTSQPTGRPTELAVHRSRCVGGHGRDQGGARRAPRSAGGRGERADRGLHGPHRREDRPRCPDQGLCHGVRPERLTNGLWVR